MTVTKESIRRAITFLETPPDVKLLSSGPLPPEPKRLPAPKVAGLLGPGTLVKYKDSTIPGEFQVIEFVKWTDHFLVLKRNSKEWRLHKSTVREWLNPHLDILRIYGNKPDWAISLSEEIDLVLKRVKIAVEETTGQKTVDLGSGYELRIYPEKLKVLLGHKSIEISQWVDCGLPGYADSVRRRPIRDFVRKVHHGQRK